MEYYPKRGVPSILANACWGNDKGGSVWDESVKPFTHFTDKDPLWATQFHIWRMDWDEDYIRIYLDDELLNEIDLSKTINGKHGHGDNPFHAPMYILLNLAMGSTGGKVDMSAMPMRYEIDYVRVYQK
jgi:beta-glucanase (GH16 family)